MAPSRTRNRTAVEHTIAALRSGGRLEDVDAAAVALARTLARALDEVDALDQPAQVASLARAHLATLRLLKGGADEPAGSALDDLLAALGDAPES